MSTLPWWVYSIYSLIAALATLALIGGAAAKKQKIPGRYQNLFELLLDALRNNFRGALGPDADKHMPLVLTLFFFIFFSNVIGQVPLFKSPTSSTNTTIGLGLLVFVYVQYVGISKNGLGGYLKHFVGPVIWLAWLFIPIEIIGEISKPVSLGMRLFGNIFGEDVLSDLATKAGEKFFIPIQVIVYPLQLFTDTIQAYIFSTLTCAYIAIMLTGHEDHNEKHVNEPSALANFDGVQHALSDA